MRAPAIVLGLAMILWAPDASAAPDDDAAALAVGLCGARPAPGVADAQKRQADAEATKAAAQAAREAAAQAAMRAAKEAAVNPGARAAAQDAARQLQARQAELDKATQDATAATDALTTKRNHEAALCKTDWSRYAGKQYPVGFIAKLDPEICPQLEALSGLDQRSDADELCKGSQNRSAPGFGTAAVNLVLGVGDLLQAEAKQEILEYLVEQIGKQFCGYKRGDIDFAKWFAHTCGKLFPANAKDSDSDRLDIGDIKAAFNQDLKDLPGYAGAVAYAWIKQRWPGADPYIAAAGVLFLIAFDLAKHDKPSEILEHLGTTADAQTKHVLCDLTDPDGAEQQRNRKACAALLLFQLARTGAKAYGQSDAPRLSVVIEDGLIAFCAVHGVDGKKQHGDCVIEPKHYDEWHTRLLEFWRAAKQMIELQRSMDAAKRSTLPAELSKRAAPEIVAALRELVRTFANILEAVSPAETSHIAQDAALVDIGLDIYQALVAQDPAALRKGLLGLLDSPVVGGKLSARTARAITIIVSLGTAKDRAEVKEILSDVVASSSSYKAKYGADHVLVTVDGYVGFFAGGEYRLQARSSAGLAIGPVRAFAPLRLATPIGLDLTLWSRPKAHLGLFFSAIDPLALEVSDAGGTVHADWATLFVPGAYVRVGAWRSPLSLAVGVNYAAGRRSSEICGTERCFDGALQFGAFLSADVPLFSLR